MRADHRRYGTGGNGFDLALGCWTILWRPTPSGTT
jgi:hypothetical protein